jgi:hypothetical protein
MMDKALRLKEETIQIIFESLVLFNLANNQQLDTFYEMIEKNQEIQVPKIVIMLNSFDVSSYEDCKDPF